MQTGFTISQTHPEFGHRRLVLTIGRQKGGLDLAITQGLLVSVIVLFCGILPLSAQGQGPAGPALEIPKSLTISNNEKSQAISLELRSDVLEVEVTKTLHLSALVSLTRGKNASFEWKADGGTIEKSTVAGEVDFVAPQTPGKVNVTVTASAPGLKSINQSISIDVLAAGALDTVVPVVVEVDTNTLKGVWVNASHTQENFKGPLRIKGTFRYDPATGDAFAGGSWPTYDMRDDGKDGDRVSGDGIWTIRFNFERSDSKVYFAFDDANEFRVEFESGVAWRLKMAWIDLDEFKDDFSNPAFIPSNPQVLSWTKAMADSGKIYSPAK